MLTGAYSSIFVASPLLGWLKARSPLFAGRRSGAGDHLVGDDLRAVVIAGPGGVRQVSARRRRAVVTEAGAPDAAAVAAAVPTGGVGTARPPAHPPPTPPQEEAPIARGPARQSVSAAECRLWAMMLRNPTDRRQSATAARHTGGAAPRASISSDHDRGCRLRTGDRHAGRRRPGCARSSARSPTSPSRASRSATSRRCSATPARSGGPSTSSPTASATSRSTGSSASSRAASSSPPRSPTTWAPASCRCARPASCRGRWCARSTSWSTAPTSWRSTATPSIPTSGCWSSTTCWPPVARPSATARLVEALGGVIVGIGILIEISALGGRAALGGRRLEALASY